MKNNQILRAWDLFCHDLHQDLYIKTFHIFKQKHLKSFNIYIVSGVCIGKFPNYNLQIPDVCMFPNYNYRFLMVCNIFCLGVQRRLIR